MTKRPATYGPDPMRRVLAHQGWHLLAYVVLGALLYVAATHLGGGPNRPWGLSAREWVSVSWVLAGVHQLYIVAFARLELYAGRLSRWLGGAAFPAFKAGFAVLGPIRLLTVVPISIATMGTLSLPRALSLGLIVVTTPFILWTFYSFVVYFGVERAMCADHFDPSYRDKPLEQRGIFKHVRNPAYAVALLILYHAGLLWQSTLALLVAAAHQAFVWCAYYFFEKPDMEYLYGGRGEQGGRRIVRRCNR